MTISKNFTAMNTRYTSCSRFVFIVESGDISKSFCPECGKPVERMFFTHLTDGNYLRNIERNRANDLFVYVKPGEDAGNYVPYTTVCNLKPALGHHYISGAVTGLPEDQVWAKFEAKEKELIARDCKAFNPVKFIYNLIRSGHIAADDYNLIICHCIHEMANLHIQEGLTVHFLRDWQTSKGCAIERDFARLIKAHLIYP